MAENGRQAVPNSGGETVDRFGGVGWAQAQGVGLPTIYSTLSSPQCANLYYRVAVPHAVWGAQASAYTIMEDHRHGITGAEMQQEWLPKMCYSDVVVMAGKPNEGAKDRLDILLNLRPAPSGFLNRMRQPPTVIWSLDDNFHYLNPINEIFLYHGTRLPDGTLLEDGDKVCIQDGTGKEQVLWRDGGQYGGKLFSVAMNKARLADMDMVLQSVHGVHFTTERLRKFYVDEVGLKNTYVYPNSILFNDYMAFKGHRIVRKDPKQVRVLWQGGEGHYPDWMEIQPRLAKVMQNHPEVMWQWWGAQYPSVVKEIPDERVEYIPWCVYDAYKLMLSMLDFDFVVAPLAANKFNEGKSSIKMYEAAALPEPKPCLASNVPPFSDDIIDGETGFLFSNHDEFEEKFGILVQNPQLRREMGQNAQQWLKENRDAELTSPPLLEWILETRESTTPEQTGALAELAKELAVDSRWKKVETSEGG